MKINIKLIGIGIVLLILALIFASSLSSAETNQETSWSEYESNDWIPEWIKNLFNVPASIIPPEVNLYSTDSASNLITFEFPIDINKLDTDRWQNSDVAGKGCLIPYETYLANRLTIQSKISIINEYQYTHCLSSLTDFCVGEQREAFNYIATNFCEKELPGIDWDPPTQNPYKIVIDQTSGYETNKGYVAVAYGCQHHSTLLGHNVYCDFDQRDVYLYSKNCPSANYINLLTFASNDAQIKSIISNTNEVCKLTGTAITYYGGACSEVDDCKGVVGSSPTTTITSTFNIKKANTGKAVHCEINNPTDMDIAWVNKNINKNIGTCNMGFRTWEDADTILGDIDQFSITLDNKYYYSSFSGYGITSDGNAYIGWCKNNYDCYALHNSARFSCIDIRSSQLKNNYPLISGSLSVCETGHLTTQEMIEICDDPNRKDYVPLNNNERWSESELASTGRCVKETIEQAAGCPVDSSKCTDASNCPDKTGYLAFCVPFVAQTGQEFGCCSYVKDTGVGETYCPNGLCDHGETYETCPSDCSKPGECGDGVCDAGENSENCVADCPVSELPIGLIIIVIVILLLLILFIQINKKKKR